MKSAKKRASAIVFSFCLLCTTVSGVTASAGFAEDTIKGSFCQGVIKSKSSSYGIETYSYSDAYFRNSAAEYQPRLATTSAYLAMASTNSARYDQTHMPNRDVKAFLEDESGVGVVEIILILVVLISLVVIFKKQVTQIVKDILTRAASDANGI